MNFDDEFRIERTTGSCEISYLSFILYAMRIGITMLTYRNEVKLLLQGYFIINI